MRFLKLPFFAASLLSFSFVSHAQTANDLNMGLQVSPGSVSQSFTLSWFGESGYSYFVQNTPDLMADWGWSPVIEKPTTDGAIHWNFTSANPSFFFRLQRVSNPEGSMLWRIDFDGDGMNNEIEYESSILDPFVANTIPAIAFSVAPGNYPTGGTVSINTESGLYTYLYYTTDGSEPTIFSDTFDAASPVSLSMDAVTQIRARIILPNGSEGAEISGIYKTGVTTGTAQTIYYGWLTATNNYGYTDSTADFVPPVSNTFFPKNYITIGTGWLSGNSFIPDTSVASQTLYYGLTAAYAGGIFRIVEGYSTDNSSFYDPRPNGTGYNYRETGKGWLTGHNSIQADLNAASQDIYLQNISFSANGELSNVWLYTTDGGSATYAGNSRTYGIGKGWITALETMIPDQTLAASEIRHFLATALGSGSNRMATTNYTSISGYGPFADVSVRLGQGWPSGSGMIPDKTVIPSDIYYGGKVFNGGVSRRVHSTVETDIYPNNGTATWTNRNFANFGPVYMTSGDTYEQAWRTMPQSVYRGTDIIWPSLSSPETNFLTYDTGDLNTSPAPEFLGVGWIESNAFLEYVDDQDGLDLTEEIAIGTNPNSSDTDGDGLKDGFEHASANLDPLVPNALTAQDFDGDGLNSLEEMLYRGNPDSDDSDGDSLKDWEEVDLGTALHLTDTDLDGVDDGDERALGTDALNRDTDGDGLLDGDEATYGTNPLVADAYERDGDSNADGLDDSIGLVLGYGPYVDDADGDGVLNAVEIAQGTDPFAADSDGDGTNDNADAFPLDPNLSSLPVVGGDTTAPVIILGAPQNAVAL
ncbi:MAG: chitobiase/beta-hexosaminidase C-terminal domain-containing protein [Verrucomicrobiota bacterium]